MASAPDSAQAIARSIAASMPQQPVRLSSHDDKVAVLFCICRRLYAVNHLSLADNGFIGPMATALLGLPGLQ